MVSLFSSYQAIAQRKHLAFLSILLLPNQALSFYYFSSSQKLIQYFLPLVQYFDPV